MTNHSRVRTGPIVWGLIVLAICGFLAHQILAGGAVDSTVWLIGLVLVLGVLLLVIGVTVLVRQRK